MGSKDGPEAPLGNAARIRRLAENWLRERGTSLEPPPLGAEAYADEPVPSFHVKRKCFDRVVAAWLDRKG